MRTLVTLFRLSPLFFLGMALLFGAVGLKDLYQTFMTVAVIDVGLIVGAYILFDWEELYEKEDDEEESEDE